MKVDEYEMTLDELPASWVEVLYESEEEQIESDDDDESVDSTIFPWHKVCRRIGYNYFLQNQN